MPADAYLPHMMRDKKVQGGKLHLIVPETIGRSVVRADIPHDRVLAAIQSV